MGAKTSIKVGSFTIPVFTFKPLSQGWFRCNQTGEKVKNCEAYARNKINGKKPRNPIPESAKYLPKVLLSKNDLWECPFSRRHIFFSKLNRANKVGVIDVCNCGKEVFIEGRSNFYL